MKTALLLIAGAALILLVYTQITVFVIPPIGAVPEGRTIILWRYSVNDGKAKGVNLKFIDTADAACTRLMGYVNLLCRGLVLGMVAENSTVLVRLPYSEALQSLAEAWMHR